MEAGATDGEKEYGAHEAGDRETNPHECAPMKASTVMS
jgi:hypothetical protein